jgi:hypothetical protein
MRQRMFAIVAVVACAVALAACNAEDTPPSPGPTSSALSSSATTATSPTPTQTKALTPEEQDLRSAEEAITLYWRVIDEAASDPTQSLNVLATVARSQALAQWQTTLAEYRTKQWKQIGRSSVDDAVAVTEDGKAFTVRACLDVSSLDVVDAAGKSIVVANRPAQQQYTYTVEKAPEGFFVIEDTLKGQPCDA